MLGHARTLKKDLIFVIALTFILLQGQAQKNRPKPYYFIQITVLNVKKIGSQLYSGNKDII